MAKYVQHVMTHFYYRVVLETIAFVVLISSGMELVVVRLKN